MESDGNICLNQMCGSALVKTNASLIVPVPFWLCNVLKDQLDLGLLAKLYSTHIIGLSRGEKHLLEDASSRNDVLGMFFFMGVETHR